MKFEGKTVFITGANRGIGNALAKARDEDLMKAVSVATDTQILINNAGTLNPGTFSDGNIDGFRRDMEVNFFPQLK